MKAARLHAYGEDLVVEEVPEPRIDGPSDVLVRIGGAGLCRTDLHIREGKLAGAVDVELPFTLGHENAGWVEAVGPAVSNVAAGDPVVVHPLMTCGFCRACRAGADMHCENGVFSGLTADGGFADLLKTSARACVKLDPRLPPHDAAVLSDAGLAAYHAVKKAVRTLDPGTTAVVIGAGGLGHVGIQCLKVLTAAQVVAVDSSPGALELAAELGADHTVTAGRDEVAAVQEASDGGADAVIDCSGDSDVNAALGMLRPMGTYFVVGYGRTLNVPTMDLVGREISIVGNLVGTSTELAELVQLAADGRVRLRTTSYALDAIGDAIADLEHGRLRGRAVILPQGGR